MTTNLAKALEPVDFKFTDPDDVKKYGDRWFTYDESSILRLPGRELLALEEEFGVPLPTILNGYRHNSVLGDLGVTWLGVRAVDAKLAGSFEDFTPICMAIEWRKTPGKSEEAEQHEDGSSPSMTSEKTDTVVLQTLPIEE